MDSIHKRYVGSHRWSSCHSRVISWVYRPSAKNYIRENYNSPCHPATTPSTEMAIGASLQFVNFAVNKIRSNALNMALFTQLCDGNYEDFRRLLLHTEVVNNYLT